MNKYIKALEDIGLYWNSGYNVDGDTAIKDLKELVERATPMKTYNPLTQGFIDYECHKCNKYICSNERKRHIKFCPSCGQALDWSDNNE